MNSLGNREKAIFRVREGIGIISFDFSKSDVLNVPRFFEELASSLEKSKCIDISLLEIRLNGFQSEKALTLVQDGEIHAAFEHAEISLHIFNTIRSPIIGIAHGFICGPLFETLLFIDYPLAASTARFSSLMLEHGYMPHMGMCSNLAELIGKQALFKFILYGIDCSARDSSVHSIVYMVAEDDALEDERQILVQSLAERGNYPVRLIKELSSHSEKLHPENAALLERYSFALCFSEPHFKRRIDQFFKRKLMSEKTS